jgi:hypothetical protein
MDEATFWLWLEGRLCHEFAGLPERRHHYLWCDGFLPDDYILEDPNPRITGRCWICNGRRPSDWTFALFLPRAFGSRDEIEWKSLLPPIDVTRWMAFDEDRRYVEIEPAAAVPDLF